MSQDSKRASIHDVARHAGVSAATVSKILRGDTTVKQANHDRVMGAIEELSYRMDPLASSLRSTQRRIIGAIVPEFESEFFSGIIGELERAAEARGYTLVTSSSRESEQRENELIDRMRDWRVSGLVLAPVSDEHGLAATKLKEIGLRSVLIDRVTADDVFDTVAADGATASYAVADHLMALGHSHILVVSLPDTAANLNARLNAFRDRCLQLSADVTIDILHCESDVDVLRGKLARYFDNGNRPTAIYSLFLKATLVALNEVRRRDLRVPDDISIVGFDDAEWMQITHPPIASVVQPVQRLAGRAMDLLLQRADGFEGPPVSVFEPCKLSWRSSTGPCARPVQSKNFA